MDKNKLDEINLSPLLEELREAITTVLFDFDGVITNTEPQYDIFFAELDKEFNLGIDDFAGSLKGKRLAETLDIQYPQFSPELKKKIIDAATAFELTMNYPLVTGIMEFIHYLKSNNYKIGLVTSSHKEKMKIAMNKLQLNGIFDTQVMAERITRGKPDPMCYLLAAEDLNAAPENCVVFEDSMAGVQSGTAAGMKVIGVSTTLPIAELQKITPYIIADFTDLGELKKFLL